MSIIHFPVYQKHHFLYTFWQHKKSENVSQQYRLLFEIQQLQNDIVTGNDCVKKYYENILYKGSSV